MRFLLYSQHFTYLNQSLFITINILSLNYRPKAKLPLKRTINPSSDFTSTRSDFLYNWERCEIPNSTMNQSFLSRVIMISVFSFFLNHLADGLDDGVGGLDGDQRFRFLQFVFG